MTDQPARNFIRRIVQIRKRLIQLRVKGKSAPCPVYTRQHICRNCKTRFTGKYCYNCGQSASVTRLNFSSVLDNLLDGITNVARGSFFTIINLFTRPGYMINDYIKGKRIIFAKPFQMLFVLAAIYTLCGQLRHPASPENESVAGQSTILAESKAESAFADVSAEAPEKSVTAGQEDSPPAELQKNEEEEESDRILESVKARWKEKMRESPFLYALLNLLYKWYHSNRALQEIFIIPFMALGMKWAFRKNRYNNRLNFIEYSFAGAFISCQMLIIALAVLLFDLTGSRIIGWSRFICTFWVCKELFRNSYFGTFWRLILSMFYILLIIILFTIIIISIIALIIAEYNNIL